RDPSLIYKIIDDFLDAVHGGTGSTGSAGSRRHINTIEDFIHFIIQLSLWDKLGFDEPADKWPFLSVQAIVSQKAQPSRLDIIRVLLVVDLHLVVLYRYRDKGQGANGRPVFL